MTTHIHHSVIPSLNLKRLPIVITRKNTRITDKHMEENSLRISFKTDSDSI